MIKGKRDQVTPTRSAIDPNRNSECWGTGDLGWVAMGGGVAQPLWKAPSSDHRASTEGQGPTALLQGTEPRFEHRDSDRPSRARP